SSSARIYRSQSVTQDGVDLFAIAFNEAEKTDRSVRRDGNGRIVPERGELSAIHERRAWRDDARHLAGGIHQEDSIEGLPLVGCSDERQVPGMAHGGPRPKGRIETTIWRSLTPRRDRPSVGAFGNEDAEIRATPVDEGAEGHATCIIESNPFGEPGEDAAGRCRIARTEEEVCGRVGRRDKDGPESRAQLDHRRKCDG